MKGPTSPVRENISPVREQRKSPVRELSLSLIKEDHFPVRVTSKTGKKRQGESNDQEERKMIKPSEEVFNQYASQTDGYDSEFERKLQSVQSLNFDKVQKIDNQCEMPPPPAAPSLLPLHKKWLTLSAVVSLLESPKPLQRK